MEKADKKLLDKIYLEIKKLSDDGILVKEIPLVTELYKSFENNPYDIFTEFRSIVDNYLVNKEDEIEDLEKFKRDLSHDLILKYIENGLFEQIGGEPDGIYTDIIREVPLSVEYNIKVIKIYNNVIKVCPFEYYTPISSSVFWLSGDILEELILLDEKTKNELTKEMINNLREFAKVSAIRTSELKEVKRSEIYVNQVEEKILDKFFPIIFGSKNKEFFNKWEKEINKTKEMYMPEEMHEHLRNNVESDIFSYESKINLTFLYDLVATSYMKVNKIKNDINKIFDEIRKSQNNNEIIKFIVLENLEFKKMKASNLSDSILKIEFQNNITKDDMFKLLEFIDKEMIKVYKNNIFGESYQMDDVSIIIREILLLNKLEQHDNDKKDNLKIKKKI